MDLMSGDGGGEMQVVDEVDVSERVESAQLDPALNVRLKPELHAAMLAAAARDELRKSVWAREVLTAVLAEGLSLAEVVAALRRWSEEPQVKQVFERRGVEPPEFGVVSRRCLHPMHRRTRFETFERCSCGKVFDLPVPSPAGGEMAPDPGSPQV